MSTLDLTGLPVNDAVSLARRKLDCKFAIEIARLEIALIDNGVSCDLIDETIEYRRAEFVAWRCEHLAELRSWLAECQGSSSLSDWPSTDQPVSVAWIV